MNKHPQKQPHLIPAIIAGSMLFIALGHWPYGYYVFLRFVVCGIGIYLAVMAYRWKRGWLSWIFGAVAILFNPFIPIYLSRNAWQPIDIACAILFIIVGIFLKSRDYKLWHNSE